jgi:hypothetical protein
LGSWLGLGGILRGLVFGVIGFGFLRRLCVWWAVGVELPRDADNPHITGLYVVEWDVVVPEGVLGRVFEKPSNGVFAFLC